MAVDPTTAKELLEAAHKAVVDAGIPEPLQEVAFTKALDVLAAGAGLAPVSIPPPAAVTPSPDSVPPTGAPDKSLAKIAEVLKLPLATVSEVFHIDGDSLSLGVGTGQLESAKAQATEQIALLIATGRQSGGWDAEWTGTAEIRPVADAYGKFDQSNFSTTIKEMDGVFSFSGTGVGRKVKVRRKGLEDAAALIKKLAGEDDS